MLFIFLTDNLRHVSGLCGIWDDDKSNDFTDKDGIAHSIEKRAGDIVLFAPMQFYEPWL